MHRLLDQADVVVLGYRPGSLDRFGLGFEDLASLARFSPALPHTHAIARRGAHLHDPVQELRATH